MKDSFYLGSYKIIFNKLLAKLMFYDSLVLIN